MARTLEAYYESGVFKPLVPIKGIKDHKRVLITINDSLSNSEKFERCIGIMPDRDALEIRSIINGEFEKVNVNEWR